MPRRQGRRAVMLTGDSRSVAFDPLQDIAWANAWWTNGPEFRALALENGAAITTVPDEIGAATLTPNTEGPTFLSTSSAMGGRPVMVTDGASVLRSAAASISVTLSYSIFWVGRSTVTVDGVYVGGQTAASATAVMCGVDALGGLDALFGGFDTGAGAKATTKRVWTSVCATGANDKFRVGATTTSGLDNGDALITRIAIGGYADAAALTTPTETEFLGVYPGDLMSSPRFLDLLAFFS